MFPTRTNVEFVSVLSRARICACGCGNAAWASRGPAAPAPVPRPSRRSPARARGAQGRIVLDGGTLAHRMARKRRSCADDGSRRARLMRRGRSRGAGRRGMTEIVTFGCRLNAYESEAIRARAAEAGLRRRGRVQHLRGDGAKRCASRARRSARPAAPIPGAKIIVTGCAAQTEPETYAAMPEVDLVLGNREKLDAASYADFGVGDCRARARQRHHVGARDGVAVRRQFRRPHPRLPAGAERLRSSLHLLHHSLWPRKFAQRADGRGGRRSATPGRGGLSRNRADRRGSDLLWRRSAGRADARHNWCARF